MGFLRGDFTWAAIRMVTLAEEGRRKLPRRTWTVKPWQWMVVCPQKGDSFTFLNWIWVTKMGSTLDYAVVYSEVTSQ